MTSRVIALSALFAAEMGQARPPQRTVSESVPCAVTGISRDLDEAGLRVHAAPDVGSRVLGLLHPGMDPEVYYHDDQPTLAEGLVGAQFTIEAVRGEWLRIADVDPVTDGISPDGSLEGPKNFQGVGWVHASLVDLLQDGESTARVGPDAKSSVAIPIVNLREATVVACHGAWAKVRSRDGEGWLPSHPNKARAAMIRTAIAPRGAGL